MTDGQHLTAVRLQEGQGTARQPIRSALALVADMGLWERVPNRGFFLPAAARAMGSVKTDAGTSEQAIYLRIASGRLSRRLPDRVSEHELMRRHGMSRLTPRRILTRSTMQELNQMRRLVGYCQQQDPDQVQRPNAEHLHIPDVLDAGDTSRAAALIYDHPGSAKARADKFQAGDPQ